MAGSKGLSNWVLRYAILIVAMIFAWIFPNFTMLRVFVIFYPMLNIGLYIVSTLRNQNLLTEGQIYFNAYQKVIFGLTCVSSGFMFFTYILPPFPYRFLSGSPARGMQGIFGISQVLLIILSYRFRGSDKPVFKDGLLKKVVQNLLCLVMYGSVLLFTMNLIFDTSEPVVNELTVVEAGSRQVRARRGTRTQHYFIIECPRCGRVRRDVTGTVYRYYTENADNQAFLADWVGFLGWEYFEIITGSEAFERGLIQEY